MPRTLSVFYCFPRSGGTLLSQCLLCAQSTVVLSEVNPAGSFLAVERQAQEWFKLITAKEAAKLEAKTYLEKIALVAQRCESQKRRLCIRDWSAVNFIPGLSPQAPAASRVLEQRLFLQEAGYAIREVVFLRRSREIFHSVRQHLPGFGGYTLAKFADHYGTYLRAVADCPKFQLEEFRRDAPATLRALCQALGLDFPQKFETGFHRQENVTGNNTLKIKPASAALSRITAGQPAAPVRREAVRDREIFATLDALAGYATASPS